jgi:K+-transporting ATPase ATPase C chain
MRELARAGLALLAFTVLCGVVYPAIVLGIGQAALSHRANGSLLRDGNEIVGSELVGQAFTQPAHFWSRRSQVGYDATSSSGANQGPSGAHGGPNPALVAATRERIDALRAADRAAGVDRSVRIPADLVTASAPGLDPHISPKAAAFQVPRVAAVRALTVDEVQALVDRFTEPRTLGILGEPRVNVLLLNRALDAEHPMAR